MSLDQLELGSETLSKKQKLQQNSSKTIKAKQNNNDLKMGKNTINQSLDYQLFIEV